MVKKFFAAMLLACVLTIAGGAKADAAEIYMGRYGDGTAVYLLTNTIVVKSRNPYNFNCRVRAGRDYLNYRFFYDGGPYYKNSEGYRGYVYGGESPIAERIYDYVTANY